MRPEQTVSGMAQETLLRQARILAQRNGEPLLEAVVGTQSGMRLKS
jgi:hypothetical protein